MEAWQPVGASGFVDAVDSNGMVAVLRAVDLGAGMVPAMPQTLATGAGFTFAVLASKTVAYTSNLGAAADGLWPYGPLPFQAVSEGAERPGGRAVALRV